MCLVVDDLHKDVLVASVHANSRPFGSSTESGTDFSVALLSFRLFRGQASNSGNDRLLLLSCSNEEEEKFVRKEEKKQKSERINLFFEVFEIAKMRSKMHTRTLKARVTRSKDKKIFL